MVFNVSHPPRPEGPAFNRPDREVGIRFMYTMSAEGAAHCMHRKIKLFLMFVFGFVPHLRRFSIAFA
jgi:hypothetical protein